MMNCRDAQRNRVWDVSSGQELYTLRLKGRSRRGGVFSVAFSPDGQLLACSGVEGAIRVWDARPGTPEMKVKQEALGLLRFLCAKRPAKEQLIESIRGDATISEPVRRRALELAETFWERHMHSTTAGEQGAP